MEYEGYLSSWYRLSLSGDIIVCLLLTLAFVDYGFLYVILFSSLATLVFLDIYLGEVNPELKADTGCCADNNLF